MTYVNDIYSNPSYPSKQEFQEAKRVMRENLGSLFDFTPKEKNPKLDELVARTVFRIPNGYQPLVAHWKATDFSKAVLPKQWENKDVIYLMMSYENEFYEILESDKVKINRNSVDLPGELVLTYDHDQLEEFQEHDELGEILDHEFKALQKFYKAKTYYVRIPRTDRHGCPEMASESVIHRELREFGLLKKNEFTNVIVEDSGDDSCMGILIKMEKRQEE